VTARLTGKGDGAFMDSLAVICEIFGAIGCNPEARTPVALSTDRGAEKVSRNKNKLPGWSWIMPA